LVFNFNLRHDSLVMQALSMRPGEAPGSTLGAALDPPPAAAVAAAVARLRGIGAVADAEGAAASSSAGGRASQTNTLATSYRTQAPVS